MTDRLCLQDVSFSFGGLAVTSDVSFLLAAGDRVALIGPNGAGKTTLVNLITGNLQQSSGRIFLDGLDTARIGIAHRVRSGLVRTFQISRLFNSLTAVENVTLAVMQRKGIAKRVFSNVLDDEEIRAEATALLDELGLSNSAHVPVRQLPYGEQRLLEIGIGLALRPKVLLLDEPAAGVPHNETHRVLDALDRLPADIAVLMIEHDMDLVFRFAKRVLVLCAGKLIYDGLPSGVSDNSEVRRAYLGNYADARASA